MNDIVEHAATVERLRRRLARERSARLQAEAIAERITSDRWQLRQQMEEKLALRTTELEAARQAASEAITDGHRRRAAESHELRTSLSALMVIAETLAEGNPVSVRQIQDIRGLLAEMQAALDAAASTTVDALPGDSPGQLPLADIVSAHEVSWHQVAARSGKLLILDIATASEQLPSGAAEEIDECVLKLIHDRAVGTEPVIELHLAVVAGQFEVS